MKQEEYPKKMYAHKELYAMSALLGTEYKTYYNETPSENAVTYTRNDLVEQLINDAYNQGYNDASKKINNVMLGVDKDYENI